MPRRTRAKAPDVGESFRICVDVTMRKFMESEDVKASNSFPESRSSPSTVLMYCTTGVLLRSFMAGEGMISSVTHIIIDEVHERDYLSDFLLIVLREALTKFRSLRLVLMSATVNAKQFSAYFNNCPIIPGAILVFLPGYEDIIQVKEQLNIEKQRSSSQLNMSLWILHSNMQKSYCASTGVSQLSTVWISQSCALQRKGRAGRVQSGVCYRIYSSLRYDSMQMYPTPEILRIPLQCWQEAKKQGRERAFCNQNFVNGATMEIIMGTRAQVLAQLRACGFIKLKGQDIKYVNTNSENWAVIKAALIGGLYPNLARVDREHGVLRTERTQGQSSHDVSTRRGRSEESVRRKSALGLDHVRRVDENRAKSLHQDCDGRVADNRRGVCWTFENSLRRIVRYALNETFVPLHSGRQCRFRQRRRRQRPWPNGDAQSRRLGHVPYRFGNRTARSSSANQMAFSSVQETPLQQAADYDGRIRDQHNRPSAQLRRACAEVEPTDRHRKAASSSWPRARPASFSIQGTNIFQGYARLAGDSPVAPELCLPEMMTHQLNPPLPVEWIKRANIPHHAARHLHNAYNDYAKVQMGRDGQ
ncbi:unnamed protein product, partial [Nesidiocoris tenuis]